MSRVFIKFPKTGLGNMLLVWAHGIVFARINNLEYTTSPWWGVRWGALFRLEKRKRLYFGYFKETSLLSLIKSYVSCQFGSVVKDPGIAMIPDNHKKNGVTYFFSSVVTDKDLFGSIRLHADFVKEELYKSISTKVKVKLSDYQVPVIGVHIRRGDFKIGNQTTSLDYYIKCIEVVRTTLQNVLPVTIFTDADESELTEVTSLSNITIACSKPDIMDILLLSESKFIVLSKSSTFGYWAAFLSDAFVIIPANDWQRKIKDESDSVNYKEVKWDFTKEESTTRLTLLLQHNEARFNIQ